MLILTESAAHNSLEYNDVSSGLEQCSQSKDPCQVCLLLLLFQTKNSWIALNGPLWLSYSQDGNKDKHHFDV